MNIKTPSPAAVFCLAEILVDEMEARGWKTRDVAARFSDSRDRRMKMLELELFLANSDQPIIIEEEFFNDLSAAFGISTEFFKNIHTQRTMFPEVRQRFDCPDGVFTS